MNKETLALELAQKLRGAGLPFIIAYINEEGEVQEKLGVGKYKTNLTPLVNDIKLILESVKHYCY